MYCKKCGTNLPENSNFCFNCGNKVSKNQVLFEDSKGQNIDTKKSKPLIQKEKTIEEPVKAAGEVAFKFDEDTTLLMDRKDLKQREKKSITNKKNPEQSLEKNSKTKKIKVHNKSTFKRFIEYMREEETYDKSFFDKKSKLPDLDKQNQAGLEEKTKAKKEKTISQVSKETKSPEILEDKTRTIEALSKEENSKKPSLFQRLNHFLKEEDEDRLLDLSHQDYQKLMKGQGLVDYDDLIEEISLDSKQDQENSGQENQFLPSIKNVLRPSKDKVSSNIEEVDFDQPLEKDPEETLKRTVSKPYTFEDKGQTIRYSKTVIDSLLDKHEKGELKKEDFDKISQYLKEPGLKEEEKSVQVETEIIKEDKTLKAKLENKSSKEKESYKELKAQPVKAKKSTSRPKEKKVKEKPKKNYIKKFFTSIGDFFRSIGKFFSITKKKDKKTKVDNIDIILSSPVESSDTMPLILSEEERIILNKEIDKRQGKTKATKVLKKSNAKIYGIIRKLLSYGIKVTLPLLLITFGLCLWSISWLINNTAFLIFFAVLKYLIIYFTIQAATNWAFKSINLRLKKSVIHFFVLVQSLIYLIIDSIYIYFTMIDDQTIEALLSILSPKIKTMAVFLLLALLLFLANYKKVKEKEGVGVFIGWYLVVSLTITVIVILLELLLATVFWPVLAKFLF